MEISDNENQKRSGTIVRIENLHNKINESGTKRLRKEIQERFSSFLINKEAEITINKEKVKPEIIDFIDSTKESIFIELTTGDVIKG
jgi:hypothetical protein